MSGPGGRFVHFRRTRLAALGLATVLVAMATGLPSGHAAKIPEGPADAGMGSAVAQIYRVDPRAASLSLSIGFGVSLSDFQNQVARAESRSIDLGLIGQLLAAPGCDPDGAGPEPPDDPTLPKEDQPQAAHAEARGESETASGSDYGVFEKFAEAAPTPSSRAFSQIAPFPDDARQVVDLVNGESETVTRMRNGVREAIATSTIDAINLVEAPTGPVVQLTGLRWEAIHRSGAKNTSTGSFTLGGLKIAGQAVPTQDPTAAFELINTALSRLGVRVSQPEIVNRRGFQFAEPLRISVVPNKRRDRVMQTVLGAIREPVREPVFGALLEDPCSDFKDPITVFDIAVGSVSGSGSFNLEAGGAQAKTSEIKGFVFNIPPPLGNVPLPTTPTIPPVQPTVPTASTPPTTPVTEPTDEDERAIAPISSDEPSASDLAIAAGIGLGLLALVAEADRRKMRNAQRLVPSEAITT